MTEISITNAQKGFNVDVDFLSDDAVILVNITFTKKDLPNLKKIVEVLEQ